MAKTDALAQLKDIHLPSPVSWWPLAPGWYGLGVLLLIVLALLLVYVNKKHRQALPKKQALALLTSYQEQFEKERDVQKTSAGISELLRRVALVYYPRAQVASLHGDAWVQFLNSTGRNVDFEPVKSMLLDSPFKSKTGESLNLKPLISRAQVWIKQRSVPCSN